MMIVFSKRGVFFGLVLLFSLGVAGSAWASCVYNKSGRTIFASLSCGSGGFDCHNSWTISSYDDKCRPGKGGEVTITILKSDGRTTASKRCEVKVDDHGWVTVTNSGDKFTIKSKHKGGSIRDKCTTTIDWSL